MKKTLIIFLMSFMLLASSCGEGNIQPLEQPGKEVKTKTYSNDLFSFEYPAKLNVESYGSTVFLYYTGMEEEPITIIVNNDERNFNLPKRKKEIEQASELMAFTNKQLEIQISSEIATIPAGSVLVVYTDTGQGAFNGRDEIEIFLPDRKHKRSITFKAAGGEGNEYEKQKEALLVIAHSFKFNDESK